MTIWFNILLYNYGRRRVISDSRVETFRGGRHKNLDKEICQNYLDLIKMDKETVEINFQHIEINKKDIPDYEGYIYSISAMKQVRMFL